MKALSMIVVEADRWTALGRLSLAAFELADARGDHWAILEGSDCELARDFARDGLPAALAALATDGRDRGRRRIGPKTLAPFWAPSRPVGWEAVPRPGRERILGGRSLLSLDA